MCNLAKLSDEARQRKNLRLPEPQVFSFYRYLRGRTII
jgi:hypothetical protein